jgi:predicted nucleic acid-binding protein
VKHLVDTSALVRILRRQADPSWRERAAHGHIAICEPVLIEVLTIAAAKAYGELEDDLLANYPWVAVPDRAWELVRTVRRALADDSAHQGLSVADHLVVATALHHRLTVLHADADFETVARVVPEFEQERIN